MPPYEIEYAAKEAEKPDVGAQPAAVPASNR
jgi:hypothetical protein